jgi:hypothetical protein
VLVEWGFIDLVGVYRPGGGQRYTINISMPLGTLYAKGPPGRFLSRVTSTPIVGRGVVLARTCTVVLSSGGWRHSASCC